MLVLFRKRDVIFDMAVSFNKHIQIKMHAKRLTSDFIESCFVFVTFIFYSFDKVTA